MASIVVQHHPVPIALVAVPDGYAQSGKADELLARYHLTAADVEEAVRDVIQRKAASG